MSKLLSRAPLRFASPFVAFAIASVLFPAHGRTQSVVKMADFRNVFANNVYVSGSGSPYDNAIQIGNQLWFTTNKGGVNDAGTISYYDLTTHAITAYVSMDNPSGNTPQSSLTQIGNTLYFTTTRGGSGDTGTVSSVTIGQSNPTITPLYSFGVAPTTSNPGAAVNPRNPGGSLTAVGNDLYYTTPNGGTGGTAYGTVSKYNTATGQNSVVYNFTTTSTANGRQPMESFTNVGGKLYFTTFTGGANVGTGYGNGSGTLSMLDPATGVVSTVASMPTGNGLFPSHNVLQASNGLLYFTTVGNATMPGSIQSFNLGTGVLSTVYALTGAATSSGPFPDGRFAYGSLAEFNGVLYFATFAGGANGNGTVDAFNLATNTFVKLADLDGATTGGMQLGSSTRGGMTVVNENGTTYLYLMTNAGGAYGSGTMLRVTPLPVPEPGTTALLLTAGAGGILWRRRRRARARRTGERVAPRLPPVRRAGEARAFSLIELLVVIGIVTALLGVALPVLSAAKGKGREVTCLANLRQIGTAYYGYAQDHDNRFPSSDVLGNSNYRAGDDPLGLPVVLTPYLDSEHTEEGKIKGGKVWLCPGGRPTLEAYGNNYAWSRADAVTTRPVSGIANIASTLLVWDNFTITLPSVYNVSEPSTGGPRAASVQYRYYAHRRYTKANYLYADGHAGVL